MLLELTRPMPDLDSFSGLALDLDGTLLDTRSELVAACKEAGHVHGFLVDQVVAANHCGHGAVAMLAAVAPHLDAQQAEAARDTFLQSYERNLGHNTPWLTGADKLVDLFLRQHKPVGVVTNKHSRFVLPLLSRLGLQERFAPVVCRDTFAQPKPDPTGLCHIASCWHVDAASVLWVGDSLTDAAAGKAAGMATLVIRSGYVPVAELAGAGDWQIDAYADLPLNSLQ